MRPDSEASDVLEYEIRRLQLGGETDEMVNQRIPRVV